MLALLLILYPLILVCVAGLSVMTSVVCSSHLLCFFVVCHFFKKNFINLYKKNLSGIPSSVRHLGST